MRQKTLVVPRRKIRALVRPARLPPAQSGVHDRLGHVEHEGQFQGGAAQGVGWALYQQNGATVEGLPAVEPTLNWVRLSQRFPVRIILENSTSESPFRMGATAVVTIQGYRGTDGSQE